MQLLVKVRNKYPIGHPSYLKGWKDGQVIDIRPSGFYKKTGLVYKTHCVIETHHDYWTLRGDTDWKSTKASVYDLKKYLSPVDSQGKLKWESFYLKSEERIRCRDWFIDFKYLLDTSLINNATFDTIYDPSKNHSDIYIDRDLTSYLVHEDIETRIISPYSSLENSKEFIASGTFSIGSGLDYDTITAFEAAIDATLTGNLTGEHNDEESVITGDVTFDTDTTGTTYLLKLTAQSGDEHNGTAYGNGARINYGTFDSITLAEGLAGTLDNMEVSNLALNAAGSGNDGVLINNGGDDGTLLCNRLLVQGDGDSDTGIEAVDAATNVMIRNCIVYSFGAEGININASGAGVTQTLYNNTSVKNAFGIRQDNAGANPMRIAKNNLCQGNTTDYSIDSAFDTIGTNVSEDATSPDASYQSKDLHTNTIFNGYATDDYTLDSGGDATNLAIVDDGENLSGTFIDDIIGQTRSTWYIGASEIVTAGVTLSERHFPRGNMRGETRGVV